MNNSPVFGITGAAGFVGSYLAEALVRRGHRVIGVDNLSSGTLANLRGILGSPHLSLIEADIREVDVAETLVRRVDVVFHLAAAVGVDRIMADPYETLDNNLRGTMSLLEATRHVHADTLWQQFPRLIVVSTSEVYGKSDTVPFQECQDLVIGSPDRTRWGYGVSKLVGEFMSLACHLQYDTPIVITRLFNTVGPRQSAKYGMGIPRMMQQALNGDPITVYGTGNQTRCFCAVQDTVRALVGLAQSRRAIGKVFNVGSTDEIRVNDLAAQIKNVADSHSEIVHIPYEAAYGAGFEDMQRRVPDTRLVRSLLGWLPAVSLRRVLVGVRDHLSRRTEHCELRAAVGV